MTYGQIRARIKKLNPGVDLELIDGWIQDIYTEILDVVPWKRLEAEIVLQSPDSYAEGTIAVTRGSNVITGTGTNWTATQSGFMIRVAAGEEYYQFNCTNDTSATFDRPYESADGSGLTYRIDQNVFLLPAQARIVRNVRAMHSGARPMERMTPTELNNHAPQRTTYGTPTIYVPTWDNFSDPPRMQLELYPVPDSPGSTGHTLSWSVECVFDQAQLDSEQTGASLLAWTRPAALIEGVQAKIDRWVASSAPEQAAAKLQTAQSHQTQFERLLSEMAQTNALQVGPQPMRMASQYRRRSAGTIHRHPAKHEGWI